MSVRSAERSREAEQRAAEEWESARIKPSAAAAGGRSGSGSEDDSECDEIPAGLDSRRRASLKRAKEREAERKWEESRGAGAKGTRAGGNYGKKGAAAIGVRKETSRVARMKSALAAPSASTPAEPPTPSSAAPEPAAPAAPSTAGAPDRKPARSAADDTRRRRSMELAAERQAEIAWEREHGAGRKAAAAPARSSPSPEPPASPTDARSGGEAGNDSQQASEPAARDTRRRASLHRNAEREAELAWEREHGAGDKTLRPKGPGGIVPAPAVAALLGAAERQGSPLSSPTAATPPPRSPVAPQSMLQALESLTIPREPENESGGNEDAAHFTLAGDVSRARAASVRREQEMAEMAAWELKVGKGGNVRDRLISDASIDDMAIDTRSQAAAPFERIKTKTDSEPDILNAPLRQSAPAFKTATLGGYGRVKQNLADPGLFRAGSDARMMEAARAEAVARTKNKSMPIQTAMETFTGSEDLGEILTSFARVKALADVDASQFATGIEFFNALRAKIAPAVDFKRAHLIRALTKKIAKFKAASSYKRCTGVELVIVGGGPVGLRAAIEFSLLESKVTLIEMRTELTRHNILHLWDWVCTDLLDLGFSNAELLGKSFYHVGTKKLQMEMLRLSLLLGVQVWSGVKFEATVPPVSSADKWAVRVSVHDTRGVNEDCPKTLPANVLMDAGGAAGPVLKACNFPQKKVKMSTALGIVAHFKKSSSDRFMEEFSVSAQFKQQTFKKLRDAGFQLENVVYYQGETHYFVMTPHPSSLKANGVIAKTGDPSQMVKRENVNRAALKEYARNVAEQFELPKATPYIDDGTECSLFDFSSRSMCKNPCKVLESKNSPHQLLVSINGDALVEPFWPEGLGINRGFLSVFDTAYTVQEYYSEGSMSKDASKKYIKTAERLFNIMRCLSAHTKKETLRDDFNSYSLDPNSRYLKWKTGW